MNGSNPAFKIPEVVRKLPHVLVLGATAVTVLAISASGGVAAPAGLVAAYSFDEGVGSAVADASGTGNPGTVANTTWTSSGKFGSALRFNGTTARVNVPSSTSLQLTTGMTLEAWVNPATVNNAWRDVIYKGDDNYYLEATSQGGSRPVGGGIIGSATAEARGTTALTANTWAHLAVTYDGATVRLYVNGTQAGSTAKTGSIRTSTNQLQIGGDSIYGQYFNGLIDEVRVYNRALTAAEIQTDMNSPIGTATDTTPPSAPGTLTATATSSTQINLSWGAATDNVGVTGYKIERCQGAGCTNFTQIAAPPGTGTTYTDTNLTASTTYTYQVRATDAATNNGPYTNTANATTLSNDDTPVPPVAAYSFDEGTGSAVADASGTGNGGTVSNTSWTTNGKFGKALVFNGTNARVNVPDAASLHLSTGMTLEAWVNPASVASAWRDVIYKGNDNYYLEGSSDHGGVPSAGGTFGGGGASAFGSSTLPTNTWSYLATTYDGATVRLYLNGVLVGSTAKTGNIASSTNQLQIGGDGLYGQYFNGLIDEVRVYNTPLPATAIQVDMTTPVSGGGSTDTQPPSPPGPLSVSAVSSSEIDLSWGPATDNVAVTGYQILRCQGALCSSFAVLAQPPGTGTTYKDTGLTASTSYSYEVRAVDAAGNLGPVSNAATTTTLTPDTTPPSAPGTLTATATSSTRINLAWGAATDNVAVAGYRIDRCQGAGCTDFSHLAQLTGTGTTYSDTPVSSNTTYNYQVRALDAEGNQGPYSNVASATTGSLGVVASYSFDEGTGTTAGDSSGNGNTGTISNATWNAAGKYGAALVFNGTNARVNIPNSTSLQLTSGMTLEAWVKPTTVNNAWRDVIYKGNDNYYLEATSSNGGPAGGGTFGSAGADAISTSPLPTNTWSHLALTYDDAALRLYVNGILVGTQAKTGTITTSTNQLQIGGDSIYGQYFNGMIDDVRIYNSAISAAQIQADMDQAGTSIPTPPTNPTASVASSTQIDLTWGASTDPAGVIGYRVERCQGEGCSNFTQIASPTATNYSDTGLTPGTSYSYRIRAIDAAGKFGPYSATVSGFTGLVVTPRQSALAPGGTAQFTAAVPGGGSPAVTWSVDGVTGGSAAVGTITSGGLYTAPATAGTHVITATTLDQTLSATATAFITDYAGTFTYHNDNMRTGQNLNEVVLNPSNVNSSGFGKLFSLPLDGVAYASPLYAVNISISGQGLHNVVYVATEHDSVYAYDANSGSTTPLWKRSFIDPANGITTVPALDTGECCDIAPEIGITSTPVIDKNTNTIYVVAKTKEVVGGTTKYVQRLHALDLSTGNEKFGGPAVIQATVPGTGAGATNGQLPFDSLRENQRTGLLLLNGVVYFGFASHGDNQPYHGWIFGYNASNLQRTLALCLTPDTEGAGVWMSGGGIASDSTGSLYYITGDGPFDGNTGGTSWGDSYIKMTTAGVVTDYFTPFNQDLLNAGNHDLGSGGALLLPDQPGPHPHEMVSSGKDGSIYLVDRDSMGHYSPTTNNIVQTLPNIFPNGSPEPGNFSPPVYFNGYVFFGPLGDKLQAFKLTNGLLSTSATFRSSATFPDRGASMSVSANGLSNGVLWAVQRNGTSSPGVLYAYDPMNSSGNVLKELYNSSQAGTRDTMGVAAKFTVPLIANGKVYVAGTTSVTAYGLLP